jgi:hypothetical protein
LKHASKPKPTPAQSTTEPKPAASAVPQRELTELQVRFCDLASDLLMNGGTHSDADLMVWALLHHEHLRQFPDWPADPKERDQEAIKQADKRAPELLQKLQRSWPAAGKAIERPKPNTVTEMAREAMRSRVEAEFREFIGLHADIEGVYFLHEVLTTANSSSGSLHDAFAYEIAADDTYVKVPRRHVELVEKYADRLAKEAEARGNAA